jgi:hypothetical protein
MRRFTILYFHANISQEAIDIQLLTQETINFECKGIHHGKRVYIIDARTENDIVNCHRLERHFNNYEETPFVMMNDK